MVFTETVLRQLLDTSPAKTISKIKSLLLDSLGCFVVLNEQCSATYSAPRQKETLSAHCSRLQAVSAMHIQFALGVSSAVIAIDESDPVCVPCAQCNTPATLFQVFVHECVAQGTIPAEASSEAAELLSVYESLAAAKSATQITASTEEAYPPHLPSTSIQDGLSNGSLSLGIISMYKHNNFEAQVELVSSNSAISKSSSLVLVSGRLHCNRALSGDTVVVRILPSTEWGPSTSASVLVNAQIVEEEETKTRDSDAMLSSSGIPYAAVVGIAKRQVDQIICSYSISSPSKTTGSLSAFPLPVNTSDLDREEHILVTPLDRKLPRIRIKTRQKRLLANMRFVVAMDTWTMDSRFPNGHLVRVMGGACDWAVEVACLLLENGVSPRPFSIAALACLPSPTSATAITTTSTTAAVAPDAYCIESLSSDHRFIASGARRDFRASQFVFSVDPSGCQDIDDAMSIAWLDAPGVVEIAVHIADVCAFVGHNSTLDLEARERATTVYLTHARFDMLPPLLSSDLASLHCGLDRLCVSVVWHVAVTRANGAPVLCTEDLLALDATDDLVFTMPELPTWSGRGIIRSSCAATYRQAHNLMYDIPPSKEEANVPVGQAGRAIPKSLWSRLRRDLRALTAFGRFLQRGREANGALDLSQGSGAELKFKIDTEGAPVEVQGKEELEIHHTISELMIACNSHVARLVHTVYPLETLFRIHPPPSASKLALLSEEVAETGVNVFKGGSSSELRQQLGSYKDTVMKSSKGKNSVDLVELLTTSVIRAMNEAKYVCSSTLSGDLLVAEASEAASQGRCVGHYGLGLKYYTHFTSPIRRYADVISHRQLLSALQVLQSRDRAAEELFTDIVKVTNTNLYCIAYFSIGTLPYIHVCVQHGEPLLISTASTSHIESGAQEDDDLDFLDSLLDGVGDELLPASSLPASLSHIAPAPAPHTAASTAAVAVSTTADTPFSASELASVCEHLNTMNRKSKACQMECQKLFLCFYFASRVEVHAALVFALRENGFMYVQCLCMEYLCARALHYHIDYLFNFLCFTVCIPRAFIPIFNYKGPVYLANDSYSCHPVRNGTTIESLDIWKESSPEQVTTLRPTQRVLVQVTADSSRMLRALSLSFIGLADASASSVADHASDLHGFETFVSSLHSSSQDDRSSDKIVVDSPKAEHASLRLFIRDKCREFACAADEPAQYNKKAKIFSQLKTVRHWIKSSGRVAFGSLESTKPIFRVHGVDTGMTFEEKERHKSDAASLSLSAGYVGAKERMEKWGEEWAEEENLPSETAYSRQDSSTGVSVGMQHVKEVAISSQRSNQLKVAKRKNKLFG